MVGGEDHIPLEHPAGGRNVLAFLWSNRMVQVPIAQVKGVHREQRRNHAKGLEVVELIGPHKLAMNEHRSQIMGRRIVRLRSPVRGDQQVHRTFAIGVGEQLNAVGRGPFDGIEYLFSGGRRIAVVAGRVIADRLVIGFIPPGRKALGLPSMVNLAPATRKRWS